MIFCVRRLAADDAGSGDRAGRVRHSKDTPHPVASIACGVTTWMRKTPPQRRRASAAPPIASEIGEASACDSLRIRRRRYLPLPDQVSPRRFPF